MPDLLASGDEVPHDKSSGCAAVLDPREGDQAAVGTDADFVPLRDESGPASRQWDDPCPFGLGVAAFETEKDPSVFAVRLHPRRRVAAWDRCQLAKGPAGGNGYFEDPVGSRHNQSPRRRCVGPCRRSGHHRARGGLDRGRKGRRIGCRQPRRGTPARANFALFPPHPDPAISASSTAILRNEGCLSSTANMMHCGELSRYWPEGEETLASSCF